MPVANTGMLGNGAMLNNGATLQCQPYEEPVMRRSLAGGREVIDTVCITRSAAVPAYYTQPAYAQPVYRDDIISRPVVQTRTVTQPARQRVVSREQVRRESDRSWGKTAMIIGGSAGGGAGIGGLIGGKKGALIGAAVGGGAATIYESTKR